MVDALAAVSHLEADKFVDSAFASSSAPFFCFYSAMSAWSLFFKTRLKKLSESKRSRDRIQTMSRATIKQVITDNKISIAFFCLFSFNNHNIETKKVYYFYIFFFIDSAYGFNVKLISKKVKLDESQLIQERLSDRIAHGPFLGCDGLIRDMALPYAPAAFHPKVLNWTRQYSSTEMCKTKDVWNATCCQTVYFWGSGKCGSTTMAMLLKHDPNVGYKFYDPTSGFVDGGKEACWAQSSSGQKEFFKLFPKSKCGTNTSEVENGLGYNIIIFAKTSSQLIEF